MGENVEVCGEQCTGPCDPIVGGLKCSAAVVCFRLVETLCHYPKNINYEERLFFSSSLFRGRGRGTERVGDELIWLLISVR